ncbi:CBL-interacting serine/threonine-protein kinase 20 [Mitosporidium daphniae]
MIFSVHILFVLLVCLNKISAAISQLDTLSSFSPKTIQQTDEVELKYLIKGTLKEISNTELDNIYLARLVKDKEFIRKKSTEELKTIKVTQSEKDYLTRVINGDFLIKHILGDVKISYTKREFSIQKKMAHKNVVSVYHMTVNEIFMEYIEGGDLFDRPWSWKTDKRYSLIFSKKLLKPSNIWVSNGGDVKITDFGGSVETKKVDSKNAGQTQGTEGTNLCERPYSDDEYDFIFTLQFVAPEHIDPKSVKPKKMKDILINNVEPTVEWILLQNQELHFTIKPNAFPTKESDVFSFAATFFSFFITASGVRYDRTYFSFSKYTKKETYKDIVDLIKTFDANLAEIIHQALDPIPEKRHTIQEVLKCLEKLPCYTKDEFKKFAEKIRQHKIWPYEKDLTIVQEARVLQKKSEK